MAEKLNFRGVVDAARFRRRRADQPPRTMKWAADVSGVSLPHIYTLIQGKRKSCPTWTIAGIAEGLGFSVQTVDAALERSREEYAAAQVAQ